jgi:hypothetical protein
VRDPREQDELRTLDAELRQALQHRRAAVEQLREMQDALNELLARARSLLARQGPGGGPGDRRGQGADEGPPLPWRGVTRNSR